MDAAFGTGSSQSYNLDFAEPSLKEVLPASQKGQAGKSGLQIKAAFNLQDKKNIILDLEITNVSAGQVNDFDIMFNKNPFGIAITGVTNALTYPTNG